MMWKNEWLEESSKTAFGNLSPKEAKKQWEAWEADLAHRSDMLGPRGVKRFLVPLGDFSSDFQDYILS